MRIFVFFVIKSLILLSLFFSQTLSKTTSSSLNLNSLKAIHNVDIDLLINIKELIQLSENPRQLLVDLQREFEIDKAKEEARRMEKKRRKILIKMENKLTGTSLFRDIYTGRY